MKMLQKPDEPEPAPDADKSIEAAIRKIDQDTQDTIKRIDDNTSEATLKKAGKVVRNAKRVISKNGKVMTITMSGTDEKGEKINNVAVYDKQ